MNIYQAEHLRQIHKYLLFLMYSYHVTYFLAAESLDINCMVINKSQ